MSTFIDALLDSGLDDSIRGVPPGTAPLRLRDVAAMGWRPAAGDMALPVLTLDEDAFAANRDLIFAYARRHGVALAPHAKTPMAPQIATGLVEAGAWGATVANLQQASVLLRAGVTRLILANEIGGRASGERLGALLAAHPVAHLHAFADSPAAVETLAAAARRAGGRPLPVLVEVGTGRGGARDRAAVEAIIAAVVAQRGLLVLDGVATYEGAAATSDPAETAANIAALMDRTAEAFALVRSLVPERPLLLTAGGSAFFDMVVAGLAPVAEADGNATLVLRSGAIFFHDHGVYERALGALDARRGFACGGATAADFRPALRLWAEVLTRPEPGLAICGFGMRDASFDQDLPRPLRVHRDGALPADGLRVTRLNDQHAFVAVAAGQELAVGDIIEFGISHPCTCIDRWRVLFGLDAEGRVRTAYRTFFG
ncbi:alanine racemase [Azospirillum picis]|uniref:D-serine dehydratase n=1 Tax=Azospirillum picis TaxID=488438 RepID=A0ABU0MMA6_9PROT|nr:alanine racemase [Azospirillum picis]MBP2300627.1 D-serine dehydratase [Azospirillum picis]MDQ0534596.1 D-serine dehydratase [Azospirillum picis]